MTSMQTEFSVSTGAQDGGCVATQQDVVALRRLHKPH